MRHLEIIAAVVLLVAILSVAADESAPPQPVATVKSMISRIGKNSRARPMRSTLQACRQDYRKLCIKRANQEGAVAPVTRLSPNECLQEKVEEIENDVCKTWVKAEKVCMNAAKATEKCNKNMDIRRCFHKIPGDDLPIECTSTDFYKSIAIRPFGLFRRNATKQE
jgi:hypothetical protein